MKHNKITTTIKLILGLQKIDEGTALINGFDIKEDFVKAIERVGTIVENPDMYIWNGLEVVIDPEYEAKQAQKETEASTAASCAPRWIRSHPKTALSIPRYPAIRTKNARSCRRMP